MTLRVKNLRNLREKRYYPTQTTSTLPAPPNVRDDTLEIWLNGIEQSREGSWTLSDDGVVTFTEALRADDVVRFVWSEP